MRVREKTIEQYLRRRVMERGGLCLKFTSPGTVGVPDRVLLLPAGRIFFVECKSPGGNFTHRQRHVAEVFSTLGHTVRLVDSRASVDLFMEEIA